VIGESDASHPKPASAANPGRADLGGRDGYDVPSLASDSG
jgi:hypothetical protein